MTTKTWARLIDGVVAELAIYPVSLLPAASGVPDAPAPQPILLVPGETIPAIWTDDVTNVADIAVGWVKGGDGKFAAPAPATPTAAALRAYAAARLAAVLAAGRTFNVASGDLPHDVLCDGTNDTRADLAILALYGQANPTGTKVWVDNDGVSTTLTGAELVTLVTAAGTWIADGYAVLGSVLAGIAAAPPTVKALADVDAALSSFG